MHSQPHRTSAANSGRPRLSIICTGRNDDRAPDQLERLISLQRTIAQALRNVSFEFLFIEWNPDPDRDYLGEALYLEQARHYVVTREAHKRLIADAQMSTRDGKAVKGERAFLLNHANNVGLKYARGEWVLITNLDDLFPLEFGALFENGESGALALGVHPLWSYKLLVRYRRAQRSAFWRNCKAAGTCLKRLSKRSLALLRWPFTFAWRVTRRMAYIARRALWMVRHVLGRVSYAVRSRLAPLRYGLRLTASRIRYRVRRRLARVRAVARAIIMRLLGGPAPRPRRRRAPWWRRLALDALGRRLASTPPLGFLWHLATLLGGVLLIIISGLRRPITTARQLRHVLRRRLQRLRAALRQTRTNLTSRVRRRGRIIAKGFYDFFFSPRVNWRVGRVQLTPGTLYRVRRQHVSAAFACRGATAASVEEYVDEVRGEAFPGPWNNHFPWTFACGDFLLMDLATWERIGGFPQQIGQLHADSVTIFRIVAEGCPVALLDWNIYHMDHDDRFDAVPYVEYDFENVHRYFGPGWTKAEATLVERGDHGVPWGGGSSAEAELSLVGASQPVALREEKR